MRSNINWEDEFKSYQKMYSDILDKLWTKTHSKAKDKKFAEKFFIDAIRFELNFVKEFYFDKQAIELLEIYNKMGFSWQNFLKEIQLLRDALLLPSNTLTPENPLLLKVKYSNNEINRMKIEALLFQDFKTKSSYVNQLHSKLFIKTRDVDLIKYAAKYFALRQFIDIKNELPKELIKSNALKWSSAKGKKIELVRLLVALNDCKYFETQGGLIPSKEQVMNYFGEVLNVNLQNYEQDLSNGLESSNATNLSIFNKLRLAMEKRIASKIQA